MDQPWWVYVLLCADGSLYTGIAVDLPARIAKHEAGEGARYTRGRGPLKLVHSEQHAGRSAALKREAAIKKMSTAKKRELIDYSSRSK